MINSLFFAVHRYAWVLEMAEKLLESSAMTGQEASKVEYQINTRIFNSAFCGLIRNGYPFTRDSGKGDFLSLSIEGNNYSCPLNSARNILRDEYEMIFDCKQDVSRNIVKFPKNRDDSVSPTRLEGPLKDTSDEVEIPMGPICDLPVREYPQDKKELADIAEPAQCMTPKASWLDFDFPDSKPVVHEIDIDENRKPDAGMEIPVPDVEDIGDIEVQGNVPAIEQVQHKPKFLPKEPAEVNVSVEEPAYTESTSPQAINPENTRPFNGTEELFGNAKRGLFTRPRGRAETPSQSVTEKKVEELSAESSSDATFPREPGPQNEPRKGFRPRGPLEKRQPEPVVIGNACSDGAKKVILSEVDEKRDYSQDGGELFQHMHRVTLQKMYGSSTSGPYRFVLWPYRLLEKFSGRAFADFLLHVTDSNGNESVYCTDGNCKEITVNVDGKEFNVFGTWVNSELETHVTLRGKTASMFTLEDDIHIIIPEKPFDDNFFEQFRLERKGQPKHFIVPFKANNRGEYNIPIIGYVEVNRKMYPLERREGNTLRYKISGNEKIIAGHWEENRFTFTVDAANRIV